VQHRPVAVELGAVELGAVEPGAGRVVRDAGLHRAAGLLE
jgi:hypothetical protein